MFSLMNALYFRISTEHMVDLAQIDEGGHLYPRSPINSLKKGTVVTVPYEDWSCRNRWLWEAYLYLTGRN